MKCHEMSCGARSAALECDARRVGGAEFRPDPAGGLHGPCPLVEHALHGGQHGAGAGETPQPVLVVRRRGRRRRRRRPPPGARPPSARAPSGTRTHRSPAPPARNSPAPSPPARRGCPPGPRGQRHACRKPAAHPGGRQRARSGTSGPIRVMSSAVATTGMSSRRAALISHAIRPTSAPRQPSGSLSRKYCCTSMTARQERSLSIRLRSRSISTSLPFARTTRPVAGYRKLRGSPRPPSLPDSHISFALHPVCPPFRPRPAGRALRQA